MSWHRTAAIMTLMIVPTLAAGTGAHAGQLLTSSSSSDAAWLATQLHQMHFAKASEQKASEQTASERSVSLSYDRADTGSLDGPHTNGFRSDGGASRVLPLAERFRGTNPTGSSRPWCAIFANMILARTGYRGTGSAAARSFAQYGRPAPGPAPGVIAVWPHHVGFVVGTAGPGRIRVVSGNHYNRVDESIYPMRGVIAFRYPVRAGGSTG
jgi:uncharacterized protein (TIGR02594 family)